MNLEIRCPNCTQTVSVDLGRRRAGGRLHGRCDACLRPFAVYGGQVLAVVTGVTAHPYPGFTELVRAAREEARADGRHS
jgi:hypothetical protein